MRVDGSIYHICFSQDLWSCLTVQPGHYGLRLSFFQLDGLLRWRFEGDDFWWPDFRQPTNIWSQEATVLAQGSQKRWCIVSQVNYNLTKCSQWWRCLWIHFWRWQKCIHMKSWWKLGGWGVCVPATSKHPWESSEQREHSRASKRKVEVEKWIIASKGILNHNHHMYAWE